MEQKFLETRDLMIPKVDTSAKTYIERGMPQIVQTLQRTIEKLEPQRECYFYCKDGRKITKGLLAGGVEMNEGREETRIFIARLNGKYGLTEDQIIVDWSWNRLAETYELAVGLVDIRKNRSFFELPLRAKEPKIGPYELFGISCFISEIDMRCWYSIIQTLIAPQDTERLLEEWFGENVTRFGY